MIRKKNAVISIEMGNYGVKAVYGIYSGGGVNVLSKAYEKMPEDAVEDGVIQDSFVIKQTVERVVDRLHAKTKDAVLVYESQEVIKREILIPKVEEEDIEQLITFEITEYLPINPDDYVISYQILNELPEEMKLEVLVVAIPRKTVDDYYNMLKEIGLNPIGMDIKSDAVVHALMLSDQFIEETVAVVDIGDAYINVVIVKNNEYELNRMIRAGLETYEGSMDALDVRTDEDREEILKKSGLYNMWMLSTEGLREKLSPHELAIAQDMNGVTDYLLDEIEKVVKFYTNKNLNNKVNRIILVGGGALIGDFQSIFSARFDLPATVYHAIQDNEGCLYVGPIGAMNPSMNFFKGYLKEKPKTNPMRLLFVVLGILLFFAVGYFMMDLIFDNTRLKNQIEELKTQIDLPANQQKIEEYAKKKDLLQYIDNSKGVIDQTVQDIFDMDMISGSLIDRIQKEIPATLFIDTMKMAEQQVTITGYAIDHYTITQFAYNLRHHAGFESVDIPSITEKSGNYAFTIFLSNTGGAQHE